MTALTATPTKVGSAVSLPGVTGPPYVFTPEVVAFSVAAASSLVFVEVFATSGVSLSGVSAQIQWSVDGTHYTQAVALHDTDAGVAGQSVIDSLSGQAVLAASSDLNAQVALVCTDPSGASRTVDVWAYAVAATITGEFA
jgi:hypothetical protein